MTPISRQYFRANTAGIVFIVAVLAALLLSIILNFTMSETPMSWCYTFIAPALYIVIVFVGGRIDGTDVPAALGLKKAPKPWQAGLAVALAVACILAFLPLASGVQWLFDLMGYHDGPSYADYSSSWGNMLLGLFGLALMPALGEECMCRGMIFGALKKKGVYFGIFLSALLFAVWHGNPVQLVHQFLIGVVMAILVHCVGSIWISVLFHFCNNAIVILYEFTYTQAGWTYTIQWWWLLIMFVVGLPLVLLLLYVFVRKSDVAPTDQEAPPSLEEGLQPAKKRFSLACFRFDDKECVRDAEEVNMVGYYAALALVGVIWLVNTIMGWVQS